MRKRLVVFNDLNGRVDFDCDSNITLDMKTLKTNIPARADCRPKIMCIATLSYAEDKREQKSLGMIYYMWGLGSMFRDDFFERCSTVFIFFNI